MITKLFTENTWIEGEAIRQLEQLQNLAGVSQVVGLPDLHPGKGFPIGAAVLSQYIHPYLIGSDIGCGMSVFTTPLKKHQIKIDKLLKKMRQVEDIPEENVSEIAQKYNLGEDLSGLGTVGYGNHFIEVLFIQELFDLNSSLEKNQIVFLVHTGSRGLGQSILDEYIRKYNHIPITHKDVEQYYLGKHDFALKWAQANRETLGRSLEQIIGEECTRILDISHNFVEKTELGFLHRKGVSSSLNELSVIPGSRGDFSFLVQPIANPQNLNSIAHGAGRKWKRSECKDRLSNKYKANELYKTKLNSQVICDNKELLYEEAPEAYKSITTVINDLEYFNLINVVAKLQPLISYKTSG